MKHKTGTGCVQLKFNKKSVRLRVSGNPKRTVCISNKDWNSFVENIERGGFKRS